MENIEATAQVEATEQTETTIETTENTSAPSDKTIGEAEAEAMAIAEAHAKQVRRSGLIKKLAGMERFRANTLKPFYEAYNALIDELHEEFGTEQYFQDPAGVVYKTTVPNGTFVEFRTRSISRTRFENEAKGSLSSKEAKEAGFEPANAERRSSKPAGTDEKA